MKHLIALVFFVLQGSALKSQPVFCPPGAEWHYLFSTERNYPYDTNNEQITYVSDSISGSDTIKILAHIRFFLRCSPPVNRTFIKQKGDTVFFQNSRTQNTWQILYNFAAQANQGWQTTIIRSDNLPATFSYLVDSVNYVQINGFNLRQLVLKPQSGLQGLKITERIGAATFLFPYTNSGNGSCDGNWFLQPLCYRDTGFGTYQLTEKSCNYFTYNAVGIPIQKNENIHFQIYPNPAQTLLNIKSEGELSLDCNIHLTNSTGANVKINPLQNINSTIPQIDISELVEGLYFLQVFKSGKLIFTEKFVKE